VICSCVERDAHGRFSSVLRRVLLLGAAFFAAGGLAACGGGIPRDAVVQVDGQAITKATFDHWIGVAVAGSATTPSGQKAAKPVVPEPPAYTACIAHLQADAELKPAKGQRVKTATQFKAQCEQQYQALRQQVLGFLISSDWVIGEAKEQGVKVSDQEVIKHLNQLEKLHFRKEVDFQKFLTSTGQTVSDLLLRVKLGTISTKIQEKVAKGGKKVTEDAVSEYYDEHKSKYVQPEKRDLRIVLTETEAAAKQAKDEIQSGKSFASVAKSKSSEPASKDNGGELPGAVKGEEQKTLSEAVFAAQPRTLEGPVKVPFGYYLYEVMAIHLAIRQGLAQVKEAIKQQLFSQGEEKALEKFSKEFQKRWKRRTECRVGYLVQDCKEYKAPKTPGKVP
jgi:foldase protein PrsA